MQSNQKFGGLQDTVQKLFPLVGSIGITNCLSTIPLQTSQGSAMQTKFV